MNFINKVIEDKNHCPECGITWKGKDIFQHFLDEYTNNWPYKYSKTIYQIEESIRKYPSLYPEGKIPDQVKNDDIKLNAYWSARSYGWTFENPKSFGCNMHGLEIPGYYDGIAFWVCENCNSYFKRFEWSDPKYLKEIE